MMKYWIAESEILSFHLPQEMKPLQKQKQFKKMIAQVIGGSEIFIFIFHRK